MLPYKKNNWDTYAEDNIIYGVNAISELINSMYSNFGKSADYKAIIIGASLVHHWSMTMMFHVIMLRLHDYFLKRLILLLVMKIPEAALLERYLLIQVMEKF